MPATLIQLSLLFGLGPKLVHVQIVARRQASQFSEASTTSNPSVSCLPLFRPRSREGVEFDGHKVDPLPGRGRKPLVLVFYSRKSRLAGCWSAFFGRLLVAIWAPCGGWVYRLILVASGCLWC